MKRHIHSLVLACLLALPGTQAAAMPVTVQPSSLSIQNVTNGEATIEVIFTRPDGTTFAPPQRTPGAPPQTTTIDWGGGPGTLSWTATASATSPALITDPPNGYFANWFTGIMVQNAGSSPARVTLDYQNHGSATATGTDALAEVFYDFACVPSTSCAVPSASAEATSATILGNTRDGLPTGEFGGLVTLSSSASGPIIMNVGSSETATVFVGSAFGGTASQSTAAIELQGSITISAITVVPLPAAMWLLAGALAGLAAARRRPTGWVSAGARESGTGVALAGTINA